MGKALVGLIETNFLLDKAILWAKNTANSARNAAGVPARTDRNL